MTRRDTYVFKTVGDCALHADVYRGSGEGARPAIVWLHGGALMLGSRRMIDPVQVERYVQAGYTVVAVDYRLAPETKLPSILSDVQDAIAWVRSEGPHLFSIDPARLAVIGHSAGGYLTLLAGRYVQPRPQALVAFYGYGDIVGPWYSTPSPFYCQLPEVTEAEAWAVVGEAETSESAGRGSADFDPARDRGRFYLYCRQRGCWPEAATGLDPARDGDELARFCPVQHIAGDHPPTMLLHGDNDTDVPYEQSVLMAAALTEAGIPHRFVTIDGGEHVFDRDMTDPATEAAFLDVETFLAHYV